MPILEPITREVHALAMESLYNSIAVAKASIEFSKTHWIDQASLLNENIQIRRVEKLRVALEYHQACYDLCPSCDDPTHRGSLR